MMSARSGTTESFSNATLVVLWVSVACGLWVTRIVHVGAEQVGGDLELQPPPAVSAASFATLTKLIFKAYRSCANIDAAQCLRKKTINLLDTLSQQRSLPLLGDDLQLIRDSAVPLNDSSFSDQTSDRSLTDSFETFLNDYRLQITLPKFTFLQSVEEGRKKKGYGAIALALAGTLLALGMAALAALSGKALAASMAALMLAAMAALKKGNGGGHSSYEVITVPSHHHRSFYEEEQQHNGDKHEHHSDQHEHQHDYQPHNLHGSGKDGGIMDSYDPSLGYYHDGPYHYHTSEVQHGYHDRSHQGNAQPMQPAYQR